MSFEYTRIPLVFLIFQLPIKRQLINSTNNYVKNLGQIKTMHVKSLSLWLHATFALSHIIAGRNLINSSWEEIVASYSCKLFLAVTLYSKPEEIPKENGCSN
jgi:hypothetical protein